MNNNKLFPGIELHVHLDGCLTPKDQLHLAAMAGVHLPADTPQELEAFVTVDNSCTSLGEYLNRFQYPISTLQKEETLKEAIQIVMRELDRQGTLYAEIRFAPQLHCNCGLTQDEVVKAVLNGMKECVAECKQLQAQLILCCMRDSGNHQANLNTIYTAQQFYGQGVCAVDLAGDELGHPAPEYADLFSIVKHEGIPFTLHAGEVGGPDSIRDALALGAKRIGHGVHAIEDEALMDQLAKEEIVLELCPTSNLHTKAIQKLSDYPEREFLSRGIRATINTDNPAISQTTLAQEYSLLKSETGLTNAQEQQLLRNAIHGAFLSADERVALEKRFDEALLVA